MRILVCGMPRSMTTWAFNVVREIITGPSPRLVWIEPGSAEEETFATAPGVVIGKCHHFNPRIAQASHLVVYSYRDLRTAAVSALRKFGSTGSREQLEVWLAAEQLWMPIAQLVLRYEDVERDPAAGVASLRRLVQEHARGTELSNLPDSEILARVEAAFSRDQKSGTEGFNPQTLILPGHRTFQPVADDLPPLELEVYMRVQRDFHDWLAARGYLDGAPRAAFSQAADPLAAYLAALMREAATKEAEIRRLGELCETTRVQLEKKLLVAQRDVNGKQVVIEEMNAAVEAYRKTFALFKVIIVPVNYVMFTLVMPFLRWATAGFRPRLGVLHQHAPRPLQLTAEPAVAPDPAPRISVVTPSFGQARYIERTILSVANQGYPNLEYFVQDGGSKDGTAALLERHAARLTGWTSEPDSGQSEAINRGFARTTGEIMAWLNSDDLLFPGALARVADYFAKHPDVDVIYGHRVLIDEDDREVGRWLMPPHDDSVLSWADFIPQETLFWRRRIWDKAGGRVDESFRFAMDWDLILRFRDAGARFARVPLFLGAFRVHPQQKTTAGISDVGFAEMDRLRERTLGRIPSRIEIRRAVVPYLMRHSATHLGWRIRSRLGMQA